MADDNILDMADRAWAKPASGFHLVSGDSVQPEAVRWLWPHWLSLGKLQLLAGSPGTGKTTIAVSLAAAITSGGGWPDGGGQTEPGD
ncbi:MAG TPA: AAA family ATPase, partial [Candidatus Sulfotelmatobacter sp.]|nr:AAA family ATPase [Candidatus Sulfotelmatobacter sp.]